MGGESINIWSDPWLPGPSGGYIRGQTINCNYTLVSELIDASTATWKVSALESLFDEEHVNKICAIPLPNSGLRDEVVWRHDGSGCYTVKIGYFLLLKELYVAPLLPVISSPDFSHFYNALWVSNLPPKVNITVWQIANNYLPTLANLRLRRLNVDTRCPLCKIATESIDHIMRDSWKEWLARTFVSLTMQHRRAVMVTFWAVWYTRNQVVHEGIVPSDHNTLSFVVAFLREHDVFNPPACLRPLRSHGSWSAPVSDVIKVNFDASFDAFVRKFVFGVVCRDSEGLILAACCYPHSYVADQFQAEALVCLVAFRFARDLGFAKVLFEGDSLTIIKKCSSEANDVSLISPVIADIKEVAKSFQHVSFTFAYRKANAVAHTLAHEGNAFSSPTYWIEDAPPRTLLAAKNERELLVFE
ncbi:hypothetical protein V6N11_077396 [Hibiscus sabdariffa]|uniref:RNase H type-1 domain-containing protein n=1 Tax=Hibiscus sabdariffa TaxID=183260 RepID=A0ABR2TD43_9ROSI